MCVHKNVYVLDYNVYLFEVPVDYRVSFRKDTMKDAKCYMFESALICACVKHDICLWLLRAMGVCIYVCVLGGVQKNMKGYCM